jgi:hypothetical protein
MAGGSAILAIKIIADASGAIRELDKVGKKTGGFTDAVGAAAVPAATIVAGLGAMTVAAAKDAAEQQQLAKVYETATGSTDDYSAAIDAAVKAGRDKAFTDTDVRKGLAPLVTATGDAAKANELLGPAMDIARLAGVDLETASNALAKAHEGQSRQLLALIPGMEKVKDPMEQIAIATGLAAGQADTYAATAPGQLLAVGDAYLELGETIGSTFLPVLQTLTDLAQSAAGFLRQHMDIVQPLAVLFGVLAVAVLAVNVAMGALALLSSPVTLFILGILAIGAGLVMLYQRSELFRNIVDAVFNIAADLVGVLRDRVIDLGNIVGAVFGGIQTVVQSVIAVIAAIFAGVQFMLSHPFEAFQNIAEGVFTAIQTAVGTAIDAIALIFTTILGFLRQPFEDFQVIAETVWTAVQTAATTAIDAIALIFSGVQEMLSGPFEAFQGVVETVFEAVKRIAQGAVDFINGILSGISDAIKTVSDAVDAINPLAAPPGGGAAATPRIAAFGLGRTARSAGGGGGGTTVNLNIQSADPTQVVRALRRWAHANGGASPLTRALDRTVR